MIGASPAMRRLFAGLAQVAARDSTVLIEGETGTGKDLAAQAIHDASARRGGRFVPVQCAALPRGLIESALFGHERGAFTGAVRSQAGAFEEAHGGTLLLDEVGGLDPEVQPKLLRALETRVIRRVGGAEPQPADVRIIASSTEPLAELVQRGRFRADLYFRLAVVRFTLPPLRRRIEDLPLLCRDLLRQIGAQDAGLLTDELLRALAGRAWPGNLRELRNCLEQVVTMGAPAPEDPGTEDATPRMELGAPFKEAKGRWIAQFERAYLADLLDRTGGNISAAARRAGLHRMQAIRLLDKHGLRPGGRAKMRAKITRP